MYENRGYLEIDGVLVSRIPKTLFSAAPFSSEIVYIARCSINMQSTKYKLDLTLRTYNCLSWPPRTPWFPAPAR